MEQQDNTQPTPVPEQPIVHEPKQAEADTVGREEIREEPATVGQEEILEPSTTENEPPPVEIPPAMGNVELLYEDVSIFPNNIADLTNIEMIPLLAMPYPLAEKIVAGTPSASRDDSESARRWKEVNEESKEFVMHGAAFNRAVEREGSQYKQFLETPKGQLGFSSPRLAEREGVKISGEKAILRVRALMGQGGLITIPLFHSGFWITIKTPSESSYIELRRRLVEDKIRLGRLTHGLVFSNVQSFTNGWLLDLIEDHLYETSLKDQTNLRSKIKVTDLPTLFWGLACSIWPKGFQYTRAALTPEGIEAKELIAGLVNVAKLMWVDNTYFTPWQKSHMSNRQSGSVTQDSLDRYQKEFAQHSGRTIVVNDHLKIHLQVPSAEAFVASGYRWINALVNIVDATFTGETDDAGRRNVAMVEHANATLLRQYGHWISSIEVDESEQTDTDVLDSIVNMLAESVEVRTKFLNEVGKFIDDSTGVVIAIPEVSPKGSGIPRFPRLIPLDVVSTFFTLLMQRVNRIMLR